MKTNFTFKTVKNSSLLLALLMWVVTIPAHGQTKHIIEASNIVFTPDELTIATGDTVEWRNIEGVHNVNGTQEAYPDNPEYFGNETGSDWTFIHVFNTAGEYDYHCDPHVNLGMTGKITVVEPVHTLTVEFSGMAPHDGQELWLAVIEKSSGIEVGRVNTTASNEFSLQIDGLEEGMSYNVDFYADFNENGMYDAPGDDHAWRLDLDNVSGDTTLIFEHNTDFTDIMWKHKLTVEFNGMTPHVGQMFKLYVVNTSDGMTKDTVTIEQISGAEFEVVSHSLMSGQSYHVNFYADFNQNGSYDLPPTDHAWQIVLENVTGDTTLVFQHNTDFTDIFNLTSVKQDFLKEVRMYPNPARNRVWIEARQVNADELDVSVYDISGKLHLFDKKVTSSHVELNIQNLEQGIYMVKIKTPSARKIIKLIKK